ncbi:MAG: hypothetical protein PHS49_04725 [Candidatus Gracilibacteria bacterium]|nr:hypothetical protein [Candidatus Gracilibacteria bacterium]
MYTNKIESADSSLEREIDNFFDDIPVDELGAVYAVIRTPKEESSRGRVGYLVQAIGQKFGPEIAQRSIQRIDSLSTQLKLPINELETYLIAKIENHPLTGVQEQASMFGEFCQDQEFIYFLDRLGLNRDLKLTLVKSLLDMEEKQGEEDLAPGREIAQFLEAVATETRKCLEPRYWEVNVRRYWAETQARFDEVFDLLDKEGIAPADINPEYASYHNMNVEWIRNGRRWLHQEIAQILATELERMTPPSPAQLRSFTDYLKTKISAENWKQLEQSLGITGIDEEGFVFSLDEVGLKKLKFQMERSALFLNPVNRSEVEANPFHEPELAIILEQYRRDNASPKPENLGKVQALRTIQSTRNRISDLTISDTEFKESARELLVSLQDLSEKDLIGMISMVSGSSKFDSDTRTLVLAQINQILG